MRWLGGEEVISAVCEVTQNSEKFPSITQVLPPVHKMAGPIKNNAGRSACVSSIFAFGTLKVGKENYEWERQKARNW